MTSKSMRDDRHSSRIDPRMRRVRRSSPRACTSRVLRWVRAATRGRPRARRASGASCCGRAPRSSSIAPHRSSRWEREVRRLRQYGDSLDEPAGEIRCDRREHHELQLGREDLPAALAVSCVRPRILEEHHHQLGCRSGALICGGADRLAPGSRMRRGRARAQGAATENRWSPAAFARSSRSMP